MIEALPGLFSYLFLIKYLRLNYACSTALPSQEKENKTYILLTIYRIYKFKLNFLTSFQLVFFFFFFQIIIPNIMLSVIT